MKLSWGQYTNISEIFEKLGKAGQSASHHVVAGRFRITCVSKSPDICLPQYACCLGITNRELEEQFIDILLTKSCVSAQFNIYVREG